MPKNTMEEVTDLMDNWRLLAVLEMLELAPPSLKDSTDVSFLGGAAVTFYLTLVGSSLSVYQKRRTGILFLTLTIEYSCPWTVM